MSYFEHYYNLRREKTLRNYSRPVNLERFDAIHWMTSEEDVWAIPEYLTTIRHTPLLGPGWRRGWARWTGGSSLPGWWAGGNAARQGFDGARRAEPLQSPWAGWKGR